MEMKPTDVCTASGGITFYHPINEEGGTKTDCQTFLDDGLRLKKDPQRIH
jgi:hypothetical protein